MKNGVYQPTELETNSKKPSMLSSLFSKDLSEKDLAPTVEKLTMHLMERNVASEAATHISNLVSAALVGKKSSFLSSSKSTVRQEFEIAIKKILTPLTSTDILRDIVAAKQSKRPYSIVFVGVNGVGKSTNLSKVAFWLVSFKSYQGSKQLLSLDCSLRYI